MRPASGARRGVEGWQLSLPTSCACAVTQASTFSPTLLSLLLFPSPLWSPWSICLPSGWGDPSDTTSHYSTISSKLTQMSRGNVLSSISGTGATGCHSGKQHLYTHTYAWSLASPLMQDILQVIQIFKDNKWNHIRKKCMNMYRILKWKELSYVFYKNTEVITDGQISL